VTKAEQILQVLQNLDGRANISIQHSRLEKIKRGLKTFIKWQIQITWKQKQLVLLVFFFIV
jgi:hypothetical protein